MSAVRSLRIRIRLTDAGSLFGLDDGRVYFRFDEAYALNPARPILSMSFMGEDDLATRARLLDPLLPATFGAGNGKLPGFFRNLLPEGMLRKHLLSPAYDIVAYAAYLGGRGHALKFSERQRGVTKLTPGVLRSLANAWELPEARLRDIVADAVDKAMRMWPDLINRSVIAEGQKVRLLAHLRAHPSGKAWHRRYGPGQT